MSAFRFSQRPIETAELRSLVADPAAGGFAAFEGWVRNHNDGRAVERLEYEAFEPLAVEEAERIIAEAQQRFAIVRAACVHRLGRLEIGELAVWVGASAHHRDEAFAACRYIIDEIKHRLPIWKKEHYVDGEAEWVNCQRCAEVHEHGHHQHLHADYSRQMALKEVGESGQAKLRAARVLVVGAGGLGVPVLSYLAGAGVGKIGIVDADSLEASNLHRQPLYALRDVGKPKAQLAAARLRELNPEITVAVHAERFTADNAARLLSGYDLAVDCSDNFATKFLLNDTCVLARKPAVFASVYQFEGQLQVCRPERNSACLRCLWPEATRDGLVGNCAEAGVLGPVPGTLGSLQAMEALRILLDLPPRADELAIIDLLTLETRRIRTSRAPECRSGECARIKGIARESAPAGLELSYASVERALGDGYTVIDIRDDNEVATAPAPGATHIPMNALLDDPAALDPERRYLLLCARGARSRAAALELRKHGMAQVFSLRGGLAAL